MEHINNLSGSVKGVETLYFEEAEVEKTRGNTPIFGAIGPLSVLYFKDYDRFVLQLNDFKYPLLRRLNINGSGRSFTLPGLNGANYNLRILGNPSNDSLKNFETILMNNSRFGGKALEKSPDDKLTRSKPTSSHIGLMEQVSQTAKNIIDSIKTKTETVKTGTKNINSTKKRTFLKDIKNKDFKKNAHSTFKKDFFQSAEKSTQDFLSRRRDNYNLNHALDFSDLRKSNNNAPVQFLLKEELEDAILNNKDVVLV